MPSIPRKRFVQAYSPLFFVLFVSIAAFLLLVPNHMMIVRWRVVASTVVFGMLIGVAEVISRYRDEPLQAVVSPFGLIYCVLNGVISLAALLLIFKYPTIFGSLANDGLAAAFAAGFGGAAVMRSKVAVIKGTDDKDVSLGPDFVIRVLLQAIDRNVDRFRAERRQASVVRNLHQ